MKILNPSLLRRASCALLAGSLLWACKSGPPVKPNAEKNAAIGIQVEFKTLLAILGNEEPSRVFFAPGVNGKILSKENLLTATWITDSRAYLLNVPPGEYVAVAGQFVQQQAASSTSAPVGGGATVSVSTGGGTNTYTIFFPERVVKQTLVRAEPNRLAVMGNYVLKVGQGGYSGMDATQKHYVDRIFPGARTGPPPTVFGIEVPPPHIAGTPVTAENSDAAIGAFLGEAREDFAETGFSTYIP